MKILTILGARPQFIKAGSVSREILKHPSVNEIIVHTGQHYDSNMSDIFFDEMKIPKPDYFLGIGGKSHGAMTGQMMEKIEHIALSVKPDWIMVYGDTNSTLAGAIVASKLKIKLAHVEAGLRSFNMNMPEEVNRILTDRVSQLLFCPTSTAVDNLKREGFDNFNAKIIKTGDVMKDGANFYAHHAVKPSFVDGKFILVTIHRAENTDNIERMTSIIEALNEISDSKDIVLPLHPRTKAAIESLGLKLKFKTVDPVGYLEMIWLISNADLIMTDSGGLQKEAYFFNKFCITLRDETEWVELVENNYNVLVGADKNQILSAYNDISSERVVKDSNKSKLYGDGKASKLIVESLLSYSS